MSLGIGAEVADTAAGFATLPDEMLVQIFGILDSVTRKRLERVCLRWQSILRDTQSLHICVDVDISCLAIPPTRFSRIEDFVTRICRTIIALLQSNPLAQTLCISGKSIVTKPWLIKNGTNIQHPSLSALLPELTSALRRGSNPVMTLTKIILDKLALPAWNIQRFIEDQSIEHTPLRHLELRDVRVLQLSLTALVTNHGGSGGGRCRYIVNGALTFGEPGSSTFFQWITLLDAGEPPLTFDEEWAYQKHVHAPSVLQKSWLLVISVASVVGKTTERLCLP